MNKKPYPFVSVEQQKEHPVWWQQWVTTVSITRRLLGVPENQLLSYQVVAQLWTGFKAEHGLEQVTLSPISMLHP